MVKCFHYNIIEKTNDFISQATKDETKYQATNPTSIQPGTKVKSGSSGQGVGVTAERGSDVTEATPTKSNF